MRKVNREIRNLGKKDGGWGGRGEGRIHLIKLVDGMGMWIFSVGELGLMLVPLYLDHLFYGFLMLRLAQINIHSFI